MNEVNMLNIGGVDYNIDDQHVRDLIAHSENGLDSQSNLPISSRHYDEGEYLIGQDRYYYEATMDIEPGDVLAEGTNLRKTILSDEIVSLKNQSSIAVIQCIAKRETGALATSSYPIIGSYLYWDYGLTAGLYETIAAITAGDALTIGVNLKSANKIADTMDGLQDAYNITGAKNLCTSLTADTVNHGITYDVLSDGSVNVTGTSDSGGSSGSGIWLDVNGITLPAGTYKLTTGQSDEVNAGVALKVVLKSNTSTTLGVSNTNDGIFTLSSPTEVIFGLNTVPPTVSINVRVFPMCRVASITDDTYVPFAMTNKQLTEIVNNDHEWSATYNAIWLPAHYALGMRPTAYIPVPLNPKKNVSLSTSGVSVNYYNGTSWVSAALGTISYKTGSIEIPITNVDGNLLASCSNVLVAVTGTFTIK